MCHFTVFTAFSSTFAPTETLRFSVVVDIFERVTFCLSVTESQTLFAF